MTPTDELQFWREMARAAEDALVNDMSGLCSLAFTVAGRDMDIYYGVKKVVMDACVAERLSPVCIVFFWPPYDWPPRRAFIARQITRLEREIGSES